MALLATGAIGLLTVEETASFLGFGTVTFDTLTGTRTGTDLDIGGTSTSLSLLLSLLLSFDSVSALEIFSDFSKSKRSFAKRSFNVNLIALESRLSSMAFISSQFQLLKLFLIPAGHPSTLI